MNTPDTRSIARLKLCLPSGSTAPQILTDHTFSTAVTLGRDAHCQIVINSDEYPVVSRQHARIEPIADNSLIQWQVCDLNAANGTYVNDVRLQGCKILSVGDRLLLGREGPEFVFEFQEVAKPQTINPAVAIAQAPSPPQPLPPIAQPAATLTLLEQASLSPTNPEVPTTIASRKSLWNLPIEDMIRILIGHSDSVRALAFSPDGQMLASGSTDKTIKLWQPDSGEMILTFSGQDSVRALAFSPDGQMLASGSTDKTIKLWAISADQEPRTWIGHNMGVNSLAFATNGQTLASGGGDKLVKLWDLNTEAEIRALTGHKMAITALAFSPDDQMLASGSGDRTIKLWNLESGTEILTISVFRSVANALRFSPNGELLAILSDDKTIRLWHLKTEQEIHTLPGQSWVGSIAISADGVLFAGGCENHAVRLWSLC